MVGTGIAVGATSVTGDCSPGADGFRTGLLDGQGGQAAPHCRSKKMSCGSPSNQEEYERFSETK